MEFEFNFGQKTLVQGIEKNEAVYASVAGVALQLSPEELVFMDKDTGENHVMTHQVLQALSLCQEFKPLDQHILTINQNMPELSNQIQAIQQVTKFLINNKLLIENKEWQEKLSKSEQQQSISNSGIVIRTCDRPKQLNRLLQSLIKYQDKFKTNFPIQVYDDSSLEKLEKEIENVCNEFKRDLNINFYGSAWQNQFIKMLKTEFTNQHETIDWLLAVKENIFTGGRVWNFALLNNAGKKFLFFDDDYIFEPRIINNKTKQLDLTDKPELSVGFSLNLTDIRESSEIYEKDVLTEMINSCGQTIGNWLSTTDIEFSSIEITGRRSLASSTLTTPSAALTASRLMPVM
ncbi:MAG: glycosyltransferase family 2 protein, partial [Alcanivoracaceae bacterium]|nr:glycosyltransferase family 2 protein [Alcanivoracaceae bacterium]